MRIFHLSILSIPCVWLLIACTANEEKDPKPELTVDDRLAALDEQIIASPRNAQLFADRARLNQARDSVTLALIDWTRALALDSTNAGFHQGISDLYFQKIRMDEAEDHLRKAVRLDPKAPGPRLKLAEIKLLQRQYNEAMGWANDALRLDQQNAKGYFLKGWIHMESGDTALAISSYRTAVEQDPTMHDAFVQLGVLHGAKGDPLALQYYNTALDLEPNSTETLYALGMFAQDNGMDSLAIKCYDRIKELDADNVLAWYNTGYILLEHKKDTRSARRQFAKAIALAPLFPEAYFNRGLTYEIDGMLDSAFVDYRQTLAIVPDYTPAANGMERLRSKGLRISR